MYVRAILLHFARYLQEEYVKKVTLFAELEFAPPANPLPANIATP
jgi:hypothetical protein